ncbi:MAG: (Fe-S)-binding protein [Candidatus Rokubacteria bacterium]|nr:(Fe-S)-binding protein [Candidatus Rokubacteria bacterium]
MSPGVPFRDTFWNVPGWAQVGLYVGGFVAIALLAWGLAARVRLWRQGQPEARFDRIPERLGLVAMHALGQVRVLSQAYPGVMHAIMFWGFLALLMGTVLATIDWDITLPLFGYKLLAGHFYLAYETVLDLFGLFFVIGLGMAVWRRFVLRPHRVDPTARFAWVLTLLFVINVSGFVMEAARLAVVEPDWAPWSPVGWLLARGMLGLGMGQGSLRATHFGVWLFHAVLSLGFVAVIPHSYFMHLITTPLNVFFAKLGPRGALRPIENIEEAESLGVSKFEEFSWKRRLDFDACVECGRCEAACPAYLAGTALSPKQVIVKLKRHMHGELPGPIHGELIKPEELWACTTCMACVQECPAFIDIVDTLVDLRRYLALSEGALPSTAPMSLQNIQRSGNPWGLPAADRLAWAEGLDVPVLEPDKEVEYLYWVGCSASYDRRNQSIARAVVRVLKAAGVSFAVLREERCHAEVARRLGEEYLYQTVAQENVEALKRYRFRKVVTHCPHCFNTIKNEFPQFGGAWEVLHHAQVIEELLAAGRLTPKKALPATLAFHDSCYLGRYNGITEAPRNVARAVPGLRLVELPRNRERGLCCGGGGGHMWMEVKSQKKINIIRVEEALEAKVDMVATGCPFCLAMVDLGRKVKEAEETLQVRDVAELVADSLEPE